VLCSIGHSDFDSRGEAILDAHKLIDLRLELSLERDPTRRQAIQSRLLSALQERWTELLELIAKEEDPERLRLLVRELEEMLEERKTQVETAPALKARSAHR